MLFKRINYAIFKSFQYRKVLSLYRHDKSLQAESVLSILPENLVSQGIKILALDFDGVLAAHGALMVNANIVPWLKHCVTVFGQENIFIITNKPSIQRAQYFEQYFPSIHFIFPKQKKPYPDSILAILEKTNSQPQALLVIDDRLLTGILASIIAGVKGCYITKPIVDFRQKRWSESFIMILRILEKCLF